MRRFTLTLFILSFLCVSVVCLARVRLVRADAQQVVIEYDGSIAPTGYPITDDGTTYALTDNIVASIVIYRPGITLDGAGYTVQLPPDYGWPGIEISNDSVTVKNTRITACGGGIQVDQAYGGATIMNNTIFLNNGIGINLNFAGGHNTIVGNTVYSNGTFMGIHVEGSAGADNNTVQDNTIYSCETGIFVDGSPNTVITGNNIYSNTVDGIRVQYGANNTFITDNNVTSNARNGIWILDQSDNGVVMNNRVMNNSNGIMFGADVSQAFCLGNTVESNTVVYNQNGFFLEYASNNIIMDNNVSSNQNGFWISLECYDNNITGNDVASNHDYGINVQVAAQCDTIVSGNNVTDNGEGIRVAASLNVTVFGNTLANNHNATIHIVNYGSDIIQQNIITSGNYGILLDRTTNNTLTENTITNTQFSFGVTGATLSDFTNYADTSNTAYGKPIYYLINQHDITINASNHPQVGYLALVNSTNITVSDLNIQHNGQGILFAYTNRSRITNCNMTNNSEGMPLIFSNFNTITGNIIADNSGNGTRLWGSSNNTIYHNSFVNNTQQAYALAANNNAWDDGYPSGGNYWSGYADTDVYSGSGQNLTGGDGIWDHAYNILNGNKDNYPLVSPLKAFSAGSWDNVPYYVDVGSNSTITAFSFNASQTLIQLTVEGPSSTTGYCRLIINNALLTPPYTVTVDATPVTPTVTTNGTHTFLYFTYTHSTHIVTITGTGVIPEYKPITTLLPLLTLTALLTTITRKRKHSKFFKK